MCENGELRAIEDVRGILDRRMERRKGIDHLVDLPFRLGENAGQAGCNGHQQ